ncbi:MAG: protein kinase [Planctomycetes bacterium]|nr:protein kinase [Planctomycetota bacterium]
MGPAPDAVEAANTVTSNGEDASQKPAGPIKAPAPPGYELLAELGRGGMGVVYKARQRALNRVVALKVVLSGGHASVSQRVRFLAEAEAVASLNHVGIVGVYEFGTWDEQPYMALEFCAGGTLADRLRGTPITPRDATVMVERLACAVVAAHERGIIHRDIKPANVLITADGMPKVGDFGLAKMTESGGITLTGAVLGTPSYMAPEQARGDTKSVGPGADIYALGAVLYECLTGRPPFRGASPADTIVQSLSQEPVGVRALNPAVPVDLETVCLKCLEKDPARRYTTAQALAEDLQRYLDGRPVIARPVGPLGRAKRWIARNQVVTGLLVTIAIAIIAGTTTTYLKYLDEAEQRATAEKAVSEKADALRRLQQTFEDLEKAKAKQELTLIKLREEKEATEDALLRGLLRPLRNQPGSPILLEETRALFDIAGLAERLRFRFVERGLESRDGSIKFTAWPQEVVGAVAGLDRATAVRLRDVVARVLRDPKTRPQSQLACAYLVCVLPPDDPEVNRLAARVFANQLAERPIPALGDLAAGFQSLIPRLQPEDASPLARTLVGRMTTEPERGALEPLRAALAPLIKRLDPTEAAALAGILVNRLVTEKTPGLSSPISTSVSALALRMTPAEAELLAVILAKNLAERIPTEKDSNAVSSCSTALTTLGQRLPPEVEQPLLGPAVRALSARCGSEKESNPLENLSSALAALAARAAPADRTTAAKALADRVESEKDPLTLQNVASALTSLAGNLSNAEIASLLKPLVSRLNTETDQNSRSNLASAISDMAARLPPAEAAALVGRSVLQFSERMMTAKDPQILPEYCASFAAVVRFLSPKDTATVAKAFVDRIVTEKDSNALDYLATGLTHVCKQLSPDQASPLAKTLADRLVTEKDVSATKPIVAGFKELIGQLTPTESAALAHRVSEAIVGQVLAEKEPDNIKILATALKELSVRVSPASAGKHAKSLAMRMATEQDSAALMSVGLALAAISGRMPPEEEAALLAAPTRQIAARLASAKEFISVNSAVTTINQLAPRLDPADAAAVVKLIVDRMVVERELAWHYLLEGLWDITVRVSSADAFNLANTLLEGVTTEKDPGILVTLFHVMPMLAARLDTDDAATFARTLTARMVAEKDAKVLQQLAAVFAILTPRLTEAELFALLKPHVAFPPIRTPVLAEFGHRSSRTQAARAAAGPVAPFVIVAPPFSTLWEFLAWVEQAHPELTIPSALAEPED